MKIALLALLTAGSFWFANDVQAQQPFVHRPHYIHERQLIPQRKPTYADYYLRKYGRLPPYTQVYVAPVQPVLPPGYRWSDTYVPGYGYVPVDPILD